MKYKSLSAIKLTVPFFLFLFIISLPTTTHANTPESADFNHDGVINIFDYNILVSNYGNPYGIWTYNSLVQNFGRAATTPTPSPSPSGLTTYGFDPGLTKKLAATFEFDSRYFESCPDSQTGRCKDTIPNGGGFYTLQNDLGIIDRDEIYRKRCTMNKDSKFVFYGNYLKGPGNSIGIQSCPNKFAWTTNSLGNLAAILTVDSSDWLWEEKTSIFTGFQSNIPYGDKYMGGNNHPNINNYSIKFKAKASDIDVDNDHHHQRSDIKLRFLVGVGWWVPSLQKGFVLEMNLDSINAGDHPNDHPEWRTNVKYTENHHFQNDAVTPLYLGGRYWDTPALLSRPELVGVGEVEYHINWTKIVKELIQDGALPPAALGSYPASFYFGPELTNPYKATMTVSEIYMLSSPSN